MIHFAHFQKIHNALGDCGILAALERKPELWGQITARQTTPGSPHKDTEAIFLRWPADQSLSAVFNDLTAVDYPAYAELPEARCMVEYILNWVNARELGRVMIVKLAPGGVITRHFDDGAYADHFKRVHVSLQSDPGNYFLVEHEPQGGEFVHMWPGEAWCFNHKRYHTVFNHSERPRIHLIIDLVPANSFFPIRKIADTERDAILSALAQMKGNRTHTARALGISIRTLRNKLADYRREGHSVTESTGGLPPGRPG